MEYNTEREALKIADYGRNVVKMIDYAKKIEDREERNQMTNTIIDVMAHLNPKVKERTDYHQILWDHLMLMANYELDVDCPYEISREGQAETQSSTLHYSNKAIRYRHYGRTLEDMVTAVAEMPEGAARTLLTCQIAHTMKRQYLQWNRDTVDDALIVEQLTELSGGRLQLPEHFRFHDSRELVEAMSASQTKREGNDKKKKKKKKKQQA